MSPCMPRAPDHLIAGALRFALAETTAPKGPDGYRGSRGLRSCRCKGKFAERRAWMEPSELHTQTHSAARPVTAGWDCASSCSDASLMSP
jgi:hypothetical protein